MPDKKQPLWKNPAVVGPTIGALIVAAVAIPPLLPKSDKTSPLRPDIESIEEFPSGSSTIVIKLTYTGALDNSDGTGINEVKVWHRHEDDDVWTEVDIAKTGQNGEFLIAGLAKPGVYYFDMVATDRAGNRSPSPDGTNGQRDYLVKIRTPVAAPSDRSSSSGVRDFIRKNPRFANSVGWIDVPVRFTVIHDEDQGQIGDDRIHQQIATLNGAFFPGQISFSLVSINRINDSALFNASRSIIEASWRPNPTAMREPEALDVISHKPNNGVIGMSSFPTGMTAMNAGIDGVTVASSAVSGGVAPFNMGQTVVHAAGHWLGLYHTFQGGCTGPGDEVDDTPAHSSPNFGKPDPSVRNGACDPSERAPVHNYMNYVDDRTGKSFTSGQYVRMKAVVALYRPNLLKGDQLALVRR